MADMTDDVFRSGYIAGQVDSGLRLEALRIASSVRWDQASVDDMVGAAEQFYAFLSAEKAGG